MDSILLALIAGSIVIGVVVLVGVLGYFIEKSEERADRKPEGDRA